MVSLRERCSSGIMTLEVGIASGVPMPVERGVQVPVPDPGGPYTPGLKPFPRPDGGRVRDPERKRAAATGSGETGCDDLRRDARSSTGDTPSFAASVETEAEFPGASVEREGDAVEVDDDDEDDAVVLVLLNPGVKVAAVVGLAPAPPSKARESEVAWPAAAERGVCLEPIAEGVNASCMLLLEDAIDAADVVDKGLPDSRLPSRLGRLERPRAGASSPSGDGARGSGLLADDADGEAAVLLVLLLLLVTAR